MAREHNAEIAASLRRAFTDCTVLQFEGADVAGAPFDAIVISAETNADFARVRAIRRAQPNTCIIVVAVRDRSDAAYVAGANEFASSYDHDQIAQVLRKTLELSPVATS